MKDYEIYLEDGTRCQGDDLIMLRNILQAHGYTLDQMEQNQVPWDKYTENESTSNAEDWLETNAFYRNRDEFVNWLDDEESRIYAEKEFDKGLEDGEIVKTDDGYVVINIV